MCPHPETIIVVGLLAQLFGAQYVELAHLPGQRLCVGKTFREQHDFSNEGVVRHHHCHRTEAYLYCR